MCMSVFREWHFDTRKPVGVFFPGEYLLSCSQLSSLPIAFCVVLRPQGGFPSIHFGIPFLIGLLPNIFYPDNGPISLSWFLVTPGCVLMLEDLELGVSNEREHVICECGSWLSHSLLSFLFPSTSL